MVHTNSQQRNLQDCSATSLAQESEHLMAQVMVREFRRSRTKRQPYRQRPGLGMMYKWFFWTLLTLPYHLKTWVFFSLGKDFDGQKCRVGFSLLFVQRTDCLVSRFSICQFRNNLFCWYNSYLYLSWSVVMNLRVFPENKKIRANNHSIIYPLAFWKHHIVTTNDVFTHHWRA